MAATTIPRVGDNVLETSASLGAGDMVLDGAPDTKYRRWRQAFEDGQSILYGVAQPNGGFETGRGVLVYGASDVIQRAEVFASSNSGALVDWGAGDKVVYSTFPAKRSEQWVRDVQVLQVVNDDPVSPNDGDRVLVHPVPLAGLFTGHGNEWATWNGTLTQWEFEAPNVGDQSTETTGSKRSFKWDGIEHFYLGSSNIGLTIDAPLPGIFHFADGASIRFGGANPGIDIDGYLTIKDAEFSTPTAVVGSAHIFVDTDGDLKVRFGDGTTKTLATNP